MKPDVRVVLNRKRRERESVEQGIFTRAIETSPCMAKMGE